MSRCSDCLRPHAIAAVLIVGATLAGCSDIYYDRRESIAFGADDAVASNKVTHTIDPWPAASANPNIPGHGDRTAAAVDRYRHNRVIPPVSNGTSSAGGGAPAAQAAPPSAVVK